MLSILVPTVSLRRSLLSRLLWTLQPQLGSQVEVIIHSSDTLPVGVKRDELFAAARGRFVASVDDDDLVADDYVATIVAAANDDADFVGFDVLYTVNGVYSGRFPHDPSRGKTVFGAPVRGVSVQMAVLAEVARSVPFPTGPHGDWAWAAAVQQTGYPHKPRYVPQALYRYDYWAAFSLPTVPDGKVRPQRDVGMWLHDPDQFRWL